MSHKNCFLCRSFLRFYLDLWLLFCTSIINIRKTAYGLMEDNPKAFSQYAVADNTIFCNAAFSVFLLTLGKSAIHLKKITFCLMLMTCNCTGLMWTILLHSFHFISSLSSTASLAVLRKGCRKAPPAPPIDHQTDWIITASCDVVFTFGFHSQSWQKHFTWT